MPNMSYCRFENTLRDLADCANAMDDDTSEREQEYRHRLISLCVEIALDYGHEVGKNLVDEGSYN
jgi:hypothetical protein